GAKNIVVRSSVGLASNALPTIAEHASPIVRRPVKAAHQRSIRRFSRIRRSAMPRASLRTSAVDAPLHRRFHTNTDAARCGGRISGVVAGLERKPMNARADG